MTDRQTPHSPLPWRHVGFVGGIGSHALMDASGGFVANTGGPPDAPGVAANSDFIVRAVNAHQQLVDALTNIVTNAVIQPDARMDGLTDTYAVPLDDIDTASAALRLAKGDNNA